MEGKLIVFEGLDYSFKETNSKRLESYIKANITDKVIRVDFPQYNEDSSIFIKKYLSKEYGDLNSLDPMVVSMFYALDRFDTFKRLDINRLLKEGYYVILDRYYGSNLCFQTAKINNKSDKKDFIEFMYKFEIGRMKLPLADLTIYMNMPVDYSYKLLQERSNKANLNKDIHESNYEYMIKVEKECEKISKKFNWNILNCLTTDKNIKSEDQIFEEILLLLFKNKILI